MVSEDSIVLGSVNSGPMLTLLVGACGRIHLAQGKQAGDLEEKRDQGALTPSKACPLPLIHFVHLLKFLPSTKIVPWAGFNLQLHGDLPYSNHNILSQANFPVSHIQSIPIVSICFLREPGSLRHPPSYPQLGKSPVSRLNISVAMTSLHPWFASCRLDCG